MSDGKPLVFNEPTATGVVQWQLHGDLALARSYLHAARNQLGLMKASHGVNELRAENGGDGGGFFHRFHTMADGTVIHTITNDGLDIVQITAPPKSKKDDREIADLLFSDKHVMIVGVCHSDDGDVATLWKVSTLGGIVAVNLQATGGLSQTHAYDVSDDGSTVVGSGGPADGDANGWYWTKASGMVHLPVAPNALGGSAFGVSAKGQYIVGAGLFDESPATQHCWVYDRLGNSYAILPGPAGDAPRISPNGLWACAGTSVWHREDTNSSWYLHTTIPAPGTESVTSLRPNNGDGTPDFTTPDTSALTDICNDGTACGSSSHWEVETYEADTLEFLPPHNKTIEHGYQHVVPLDSPSFRWSPGSGISDAGYNCNTTQIAGDTEGKVFVGNNSHGIKGTIGPFVDEMFGDTFYQRGVYVEFHPYGVRVGDGTVVYPDDTALRGISDDGKIVVGLVRDSGGNDMPAMWRNGALSYLPLAAGFGGRAESVTTKAKKEHFFIDLSVPPYGKQVDPNEPDGYHHKRITSSS